MQRSYYLLSGVIAVALTAGLALNLQKQPDAPTLKPSFQVTPEVMSRVQLAMNAPVPLSGEGSMQYTSSAASVIEMSEVTPMPASGNGEPLVVGGPRIESKFSDAEVDAAIAEAMANAPTGNTQTLNGADNLGVNNNGNGVGIGKKGPKLLQEFDSIGAEDCCNDEPFGATVPPDPDIAVGPNHVIVVVNVAFAIYDKQGNELQPPTGFRSFFDGTPGCSFDGTFDPDVVYDESADRFVMGVDGALIDYCVAATTSGDPLGSWNRFGFPTNINGELFDFPHIGIGVDAVYMGSNQFGFDPATGFFFVGGRVFAMNKQDLFDGNPLQVVTELLPRFDGTPQPAHLTGVSNGTFPTSGPHYIMSEVFDGITHSVYSWDDPFGANLFQLEGDVDLATASGVPCPAFSCFPLPFPQAGSPELLQGNDFRGQETKFRNGNLWTAQTIACDPGTGSGPVNCIRWAQIDPTAVNLPTSTDGVLQAGVFTSDDGSFRQFPSLAVNACDDMAIGYTRSSTSEFPSVAVTGRRSNDLPGRVRSEIDQFDGTEFYRSFQAPGPHRWGDYSGMAPDPDGRRFWYVGEYAGFSSNPFANWRNSVAEYRFSCNGR